MSAAFIVVPAKAGTQGQTLIRQLIVEVTPLRIMVLNQFKLPGAPPFLDPLFAEDGIGHGPVKFGKDQPVDSVVLHKAGHCIRPMLPDAANEIVGDAGIKRTVAFARKDIDARAVLHHSRNQWPWVPAFAGTT